MARAARGALVGWTINGLPASDRMRRHLAAALAWPERAATAVLAQLADVRFFPASAEPTPLA